MIELSGSISQYISKHFGNEYLSNYTNYFNSNYKPYLRISPFVNQRKLIERLKNYGINLEAILKIPNAYRIISGDEAAGKTLEFILGKYYIQSLSSMIPALVLAPNESDVVLDLCAAPGSKTTQLSELMNNKGTLIANEISAERLKSLVFNVDKMSLVNVGILHGKGELLSKQFENRFDKILVDAPCSALGIVQKKGEVSNWWNIKKAQGLSEQQLRLLIGAVKMCKVGGEIVYSTCTLTLEENEYVINKVLKKYPVELIEIKIPVISNEGFAWAPPKEYRQVGISTKAFGEKFGDEELSSELKKTRRILPWEINSEGFFVAKLRKIDDTERTEKISCQITGNPPQGSRQVGITLREKYNLIKSSSGKIKNYLEALSNYYGIPRNKFDEYKYLIKNNDIHFVDANWDSDHLGTFNRIGTRLGTIDKRRNLQLNSLAAQVFGEAITQNIIEFENTNELDIYFSGGTIKKYFEAGGQRVVKYGDYFLGTAVASKEGLKSQFPRAFRTQEIILPR